MGARGKLCLSKSVSRNLGEGRRTNGRRRSTCIPARHKRVGARSGTLKGTKRSRAPCCYALSTSSLKTCGNCRRFGRPISSGKLNPGLAFLWPRHDVSQ